MATDTRQLNDTEIGKDANVLIMELNKGLQSPNFGEQCKAIAQFPSLLEKYPFPMVVNSVFLKITQIFCDGNNYLRFCVLRSCAVCRSHLEKLTVCDDVVRKLMPFTTSNDPVTRALTLRLFGTLNRITREHIGVHHAIFKQIESHYSVESDAAIWASHQLAPISSSFSASLCPILCKRLMDLSTELDVKLKLLRLGKHMHHDIRIIEQMRVCLVQMLTDYNTSEFVVSIMDTLTRLESSSPIHTGKQIDLLINYLMSDDRLGVRLQSLNCLRTLAVQQPHQWGEEHVMKLCSFYTSSANAPTELENVLNVLLQLACSHHTADVLRRCSSKTDSGVVPCIMLALLTLPATPVTLKAIQLACKLTLLLHTSDSETGTCETNACALQPSELVCLLVAQFSANTKLDDNVSSEQLPWYLASGDLSLEELKQTYFLMILLFDAFPEYASSVYRMGLFEHVRLGGNPRLGLLCQFLSTVCMRLPLDEQSTPVTTLLQQIERSAGQSTDCIADRTESILPVCGLVFQLSEGVFLPRDAQQALLLAVARCLSVDCTEAQSSLREMPTWTAYQLARQASRYGQHEFASMMYDHLIPKTNSERTNFWIRGLRELSQAEARLLRQSRCLKVTQPEIATESIQKPQHWVDQLIESLRRAADEVCRSRTTFMCVGGPDKRWFQAEYVGIRSTLYLYLAELCMSANCCTHLRRTFRTEAPSSQIKPDPTTQPSITCPSWITRHQTLWSDLETRVSSLQAQCLDADHRTHCHLYALLYEISSYARIMQLVKLFIYTLQTVFSIYQSPDSDLPNLDQLTTESNELSAKGDPFYSLVMELHDIVQSNSTPSHQGHPNLSWIPYLSLRVAQVASHWPRFFFQRFQTSTVRLVLLPKAGSSPEDVLTISDEVGHMVQVMGVVQQRSLHITDAQTESRRIHAVEVELTVTEITASSGESQQRHRSSHRNQAGDVIVFISKRTAQLQRDYFHCEFCVQFPGHTRLKSGTGGSDNSLSKTTPNRSPGDRMYCISTTAMLLDSVGRRWRLTHASGAPRESTLVRVETTLHPTATVPIVSTPSVSDAPDSGSSSAVSSGRNPISVIVPPVGTTRLST